ncbi:LysM domain-containing protein [Rahnella sp. BIGb0236]|uniref:peptidoglycan DD-metalloendopeptidase family protein n=1 Tax=Rahnella sp. BIGb0236 TaxID=2485117 RepID=UPI0010606AD3|nr:peptidoglycan DD-metalloendopeptidase family protein [Rahnella sp. BIGb0236]TDS97887.1 LysM domain-containing protein [Rahnella sp. BIGb0236]
MEKYTVQTGDSLWKISRNFSIEISELCRINGLNTKAEQHIIQPGQILNLPTKDKSYDTQLNLRIYDLAWRPLSNAKLKLIFDNKTHEYVTDGSGAVNGLLVEDSTQGIKVELQHLNKREYIVIADHKKLPLGKKTLKISSREMVIKGSTSVEKGPQLSSKQQEKENARQESKTSSSQKGVSDTKTASNKESTINQTTRTESGIPTSVSNIGNVSEGLRLPPVAEKYRNSIIEASNKYDFQPEGFSALIEAETSWIASAANSKSTAAGLGQFVENTWLSYSANSSSKVYQNLTKTYGYTALKYSAQSKKFYGTSPDGIQHEINLQSILALRMDAAYSIDMIGLYDKELINNLTKRFPSISTLTSDQLMMVAYLCHHNGEAGAYDIISNGKDTSKYYGRTYSDAEYDFKLNKNVTDKDAERFLSIDKTSRTAYIAWLVERYDSAIVLDHFRIEPTGVKISLKNVLEKINPDLNVKTLLPPPNQKSGGNTGNAGNAGNAGDTSGWHNPLDICKIRTHGLRSARSASFGPNVRTDSHGMPRAHQGIDIAAEPGATIYAVADGRIAFITNPARGDYGKQVCIIVQASDLPDDKASLCIYKGKPINNIYFFYAHLSEISSHLSQNSFIKCGDTLGKTGNTGNAHSMTSISLGAHLHFEVRTKAATGKGVLDHIDPAVFIDGFDYPTKKD